MAPSGSQASVPSQPILALSHGAQTAHRQQTASFDLTALSLFQASIGAAVICTVIWTSISYIILG